MLEEGRHIFRADVLTLHRAIAGAKHGGVGDGVSPRAPLDGRFGTLRDVLERYDRLFRLGLTEVEKTDLGEYVKSL
jgi:hypothetical protein